ncbi:MAG: hypothetical protein FWG92_01195 [Leptospirales bacterium]|nr:hypothetical protein [Leptospirales bacterium]
MKLYKIIPFVILCLFSCTTTDTIEYTPSKESNPALLNNIALINDNAPSYYDITFTIEGLLNNQKYKLIGNAQLDAKLNLFCLSLTDFIFKSPISTVLSNNDETILYFPTEKRLFRYTNNSFDLKTFWNINLDYEIIRILASCRIPLIDNYKVKESATSADNASYLILENKRYFETITFKNNIPDKIKIMDKNDRSETDFHLLSPRKYNETLVYRKISVLSKSFSFDISLNSIKVNTPVKVKTINDIKIPRDVVSTSIGR